MAGERRATTVAVGGGKGGVGKSIVAANLGLAFARLGMRTILVDADLGAANQHTFFGIDRPGVGLFGLLDREVESLEEVTIETAEPRLRILPSSTGRVGAANLASAQKTKLLRHVARLDAEIVIIDVGAGVAWNTIDFFLASDLRLGVTTPQLPAIQNLYCFLKGALHRELRAEAANDSERNAFVGVGEGKESARIGDLLRHVDGEQPALAARLRSHLAAFGGSLVGNLVEPGSGEKRGGGAVHALSRMLRDFLGIEVPVRALLPSDRALHASVSRRSPLGLSRPDHEVSRAFDALAEQLLGVDIAALRSTRDCLSDAAPLASGDRQSDPRELGAGDPIAPYARRDERIEVSWPSRLIAMGRTTSVCVRDVSLHGMAIEGDVSHVSRGALVVVELDSGARVTATVRHAAPDGCGLEVEERFVPIMRLLVAGATRPALGGAA